MELLYNLALGFDTALTLQNLFYAFIGCLFGTLVGVLPGIGSLATIAMLLPFTFGLPPVTGLIMLSGIYYGAQYGGSTTAILVNLPGETSSVVSCIDGHQMARNGRAGVALGVAALSSFFAGCVATLLIAAFAAPLASVAFKFGPAENFSLMVVGLVGAVVLASGSLIKAIAMTVTGLLLGLAGTDINTGVARFSFQVPQLTEGLSVVALSMGMFGLAEIMLNLEKQQTREAITVKLRHLWPSKADLKRMVPSVIRGTTIGSVLGLLPGGGAALASFIAYSVEKKTSKHNAEFGKGAIEGLAGPESANNAAAQTCFIPLLTLGIPSNAVMALMMGAMIVHNIQPSPMIISKEPGLFWGLIASMWIGNLILVILNMPLIGIWVQLLRLPYRYLYSAILVFCCIGVYSVQNTTFDVMEMAAFGVIGYLFVKLGCEPAPLLMGFVLSPLMEESFRRALLISNGDPTVFVQSPIALGLLTLAFILVLAVALPAIKRKREEAFREV